MIGILGGMGTQAGLDFCSKLAKINRGKADQKYPLFVLYNKSNIPDRKQNLKKYKKILKSLVDGCKFLQKNNAPPVKHPVVRTHPSTKRKSLFLGDHAEYIEGMDYLKGRNLIEQLNKLATKSKFIYKHKYKEGDVLVWDNRRLLHKGTKYDTAKEKKREK